MKNLKTLFTALMMVLIATAYGQGFAFSVMVNKGTNKVKSGSEWQPLRTGAKLQKTDELKVSENAYIGLLHSGGKTIEIKEAGTYSISDLESKVPEGQSVASKYADFLASKMTAEAKKNRLSATGAVHRNLGMDAINVYMPESAQIYKDDVVVRWEAVEAEDITYHVKLMDMFEEVLVSAETTDTYYKVDFSDPKIAKQSVVLLVVTTAEDETIKSKTYPLKRLGADEKEQVQSDLGDLLSDVKEETALNKYILAGFYEENNLLVDALTSYEEAIDLAPEVDTFKEAYEEFLLRNGLKKEK